MRTTSRLAKLKTIPGNGAIDGVKSLNVFHIMIYILQITSVELGEYFAKIFIILKIVQTTGILPAPYNQMIAETSCHEVIVVHWTQSSQKNVTAGGSMTQQECFHRLLSSPGI